MKKSSRNLRIGMSLALVLGSIAVVRPANAQITTYTSQSAFINALHDPAYFESFNEYPGQVTPSPQAFSFGPVGFVLSDSDNNIYYSDGSGSEGSIFPSVENTADSFTLTFTGNVTAVGGTFFLTDLNFDSVGGFNVTAQLGTGENVVLMSTSDYNTQPFGGFVSASAPILSLTISNADGASAFVSLDNLYVSGTAAVPEPSTWALGIVGSAALLFARRRARSA